MQVGSWGELQSAVKSGAVSLEQAIGLKEGTPSQSSFRENLHVHGISEKPLVFQFSDPADLDVFGAVQAEEGPVVLPPFLTLNNLLQPEYIPPKGSQDMKPLSQQAERRDVLLAHNSKQPLGTAQNLQTQNKDSNTSYSSKPVSRTLKRKRKHSLSESDDVIDLTQDS